MTQKDDELDEGVDLHGDVIRKPTTRRTIFGRRWRAFVTNWVASGENLADKIWAFGPHSAGGCILVDARAGDAISR